MIGATGLPPEAANLSPIGVDETEDDYTLKELAECAQDMLTQCDLFAEFIAATWPECVALSKLPE